MQYFTMVLSKAGGEKAGYLMQSEQKITAEVVNLGLMKNPADSDKQFHGSQHQRTGYHVFRLELLGKLFMLENKIVFPLVS